MKKLSPILFFLLICNMGRAQNTVVDTYPLAQIFAINYQTGQEVQVAGDQAIAFKDAFIDLVLATPESQQLLRMGGPGRKVALIKQIDPQKLNGYQLTWQSIAFNHAHALGTFYYNIDQNALFFFEQGNWVNVPIANNNAINLANCQTYSKFNSQQSVPDLSANNAAPQQGVPDLSANGGGQQGAPDLQTAVDTLSNEDISASVAPPALPDYDQPPCPTDGYLWQPGYWAYSPTAADYYWVPGVWLAPPHPGLLWTPGYWGFFGGYYRFHRGYWGASVGFYGGINYGFGYVGVGFVGGEWHGGVFRYNTAVVHVNTVVVHNTYVNNTVIHNTTVVNHTSFNGQGGVTARPTSQEQAAAHEQHFNPTSQQVAHQQAAVNNKAQFASVNKGAPAVTTMAHPAPAPANSGNQGARNLSSKTPNTGNNSGGQRQGQGRGKQPKQSRGKKQKN